MKIRNIDLITISNELNGLHTDNLSFKGLLNESISLKTKYWLQKLSKEIESNKKDFVGIYQEWVKDNEDNYQKFLTENMDLVTTEIEIKDYQFNIEDFDFKSEYGYYGFISLFIDKDDQN